MGVNQHAVFFSHARETVTYQYERNPADPRVTHVLTLEVDAFGNVLRGVSIGYPRRTGYPLPEPALSAATQQHARPRPGPAAHSGDGKPIHQRRRYRGSRTASRCPRRAWWRN
jgi:hypothetical protein